MNRALSLIRRDPWRDFDRFFDEFFSPVSFSKEASQSFQPSVDVEETDSHFFMSFDLPGLSEKDIKVDLNDRFLSVSGERKFERNDSEKRFFERSYGSFERSFRLPESIDVEKIEADYENGVLRVALPKTEATRPRKVEVKVGKGSFVKKFFEKNETSEKAS